MQPEQVVLVLDFGSQYTQLIARRIRENSVYSVVHPFDFPIDKIRELAPRAIILSGGPQSVYSESAPICSREVFELGVPILGICYGMQSLNVWRTGTLVQHIESAKVNHEAGRNVEFAHSVQVAPESKLAALVGATTFQVNSSHHQSADLPGDGLRVVAKCPEDGIIEALEGTAPDHFVLAVQWHPERTYEVDESSKSIFREFVKAARAWKPREVSESVG